MQTLAVVFFESVNLSNADLRDVKAHRVWMSNAKLRGALVKGLDFGEHPCFNIGDNINQFDYREDIDRLAVMHDDYISIWEISTCQCLVHKFIPWYKPSKLKIHIKFNYFGDKLIIFHGNYIFTLDIKTDAIDFLIRLDRCDLISNVSLNLSKNLVALGCVGGKIILCNLTDGKAVKEKFIKLTPRNKTKLTCMCIGPNGDDVALGYSDGHVALWHEKKGLIFLSRHKSAVASVAFSSTGNIVFSVGSAYVHIWNVSSNKLLISQRLLEQGYLVTVHFTFSENCEYLASVSFREDILIRDLVSKKVVSKLPARMYDIKQMKFTPDYKKIVVICYDNTIWILAMSATIAPSPQDTNANRGRHDYKKSFLINHEQDRIIFAIVNDIYIREMKNGHLASKLKGIGHYGDVLDISMNFSGNIIVTSHSMITCMRIWNLKTESVIEIFNVPGEHTKSLCFKPASDVFFSAGDDQAIRLWNARNGNELDIFLGHDSPISCLSINASGDRLFSGCEGGVIIVWDIASKTIISKYYHDNKVIHNLTYNSFTNKIITAVKENKSVNLYVRDIDNEEVGLLPYKHYLGFSKMSLCTSDEWLISSGSDGVIILWDLKQSKILTQFKINEEIIGVFCNKKIIVAASNSNIYCWQKQYDVAQTWKLLWTTATHSSTLVATGIDISKIVDLDDHNRLLLGQHGAIVDKESKQTNVQLLTKTGHNSGSPIHTKPSTEDKKTFETKKCTDSSFRVSEKK